MGQSFPNSTPSYADTTGDEVLGSAGNGLGLSRILDDYGLDIAALATKVGADSSAVTSSHDYKLSRVTGSAKAVSTGDNLSALTATTSAQLAGIISDETGSGALVFGTSPTIVTPTIASFANATHNHSNAAGGGNIGTSGLSNGAITPDKLDLDPVQAAVATDQSTASTSYADLATSGPAATITVGANGLALVAFSAGIYNAAAVKRVSVAISGATTAAASDTWSIRNDIAAFQGTQSFFYLFSLLTPGSTTFTLKYKTASGTANFFERNITAVPL